MKTGPLDHIDEMLKTPELLTESELEWVRKMDQTMARYSDPSPTPRQAEVIRDIYHRFSNRRDCAERSQGKGGIRRPAPTATHACKRPGTLPAKPTLGDLHPGAKARQTAIRAIVDGMDIAKAIAIRAMQAAGGVEALPEASRGRALNAAIHVVRHRLARAIDEVFTSDQDLLACARYFSSPARVFHDAAFAKMHNDASPIDIVKEAMASPHMPKEARSALEARIAIREAGRSTRDRREDVTYDGITLTCFMPGSIGEDEN